MELDLLTAISPIDGRYRGKTDALAAYFSEFALIKYRVRVEIEYFIALCELPLPQLAGVDKGVFETLRNIYRNFSEADAQRIKEIESVTNHDQPFMSCVLGASFCGAGIGVAFSANGSTGGTDIIAAIINKYRDITLGRVILICDVIIISSSYLVLHNWEKVVYGYVVLFISSFVLDQVVNSARQSVQFFIISSKYEEIGARINKDLHRGVTFIDGVGCYTHNGVKMMFVLAKKRESNIIFRLIKDIDPKAFVSQSAVIGVFGEGFDRIKVK